MITPTRLVEHLMTYVPRLTNLFNTQFDASATVSGSTVTFTTASAHGLSVGQNITVGNALYNNILVSVVDNGDGTATFTTSDNHDLVEPLQPADPQTLQLSGVGAWDGIHQIGEVPNRKNFTISFPDGVVTLPTLTATSYIQEDRPLGLSGGQTVATVPTATTFTIEVSSNIPPLPSGGIDSVSIQTGINIGSAENANQARHAYTINSERTPYLFVVMDGSITSKDRRTETDAVATISSTTNSKLVTLQNFSILFVQNSSDQNNAQLAQDLAHSTVKAVLYNALYGFDFAEGIEPSLCVPVGDGPMMYDSATIGHAYDFQVPVSIDESFAFDFIESAAFRDIDMTLFNNNDEEAPLDDNINLDKEPL